MHHEKQPAPLTAVYCETAACKLPPRTLAETFASGRIISEKVAGKIAEHVQPPAKYMLKRSNLCTNSAILNFFRDLFLQGSNLCLKSTRNPIQQC